MYNIWIYYLLIKTQNYIVRWRYLKFWKSRTLPFARFVSYVPYSDIIFSQSAYEEFISTHVKICTQWTTKTLNMSLKDSMCFLAITYGKTYLHFPYKTHFCNTHSGWLQLPVVASSGTPKHLTTEIRLTRPRVRSGRWIVVNLRCRRWMLNYNIHIIYLEYYLALLFGNDAQKTDLKLGYTSCSKLYLYFSIIIIHMTTSAFFTTVLFKQLYVKFGIIPTCGKHLKDCVTLHKRLNSSRFIWWDPCC